MLTNKRGVIVFTAQQSRAQVVTKKQFVFVQLFAMNVTHTHTHTHARTQSHTRAHNHKRISPAHFPSLVPTPDPGENGDSDRPAGATFTKGSSNEIK